LSIFDFLIEEDREKARDAIIQIINNKAVTNNHYTVYRKDGTKFAAELNSSLLCDSNGKPKGLITIIRDITDRKVFEEKLIESEEKYSSLIRYSSDPIFSFNPDETYRFVNEAFATPFGKTPEEIMGKTPHSIFSYEEAEKRLMAVRAVFKSGEKKEIEVRVDTVSGDINYYLTIVDPIKNEAGEIICVSCISKNITERKKIEQELQVSEERYRRLHETMRDCFVEVKMSGEIIEVNQSYIDMLGYTKEEIYKLKYTDITPEKWIEFEKMIVENEVLVLGYSGVYEKEYIKKDGTVFPVELRTYLIRDNNNNPLAMWAIVRDISERKLAEEELLESEVKYRELVQNSPDTIVIYIDGKIAFTNNAGLDLVKAKSLDQVLGKPILDFVHPQSVDLAKQRMKDITLTSNLLPIAEERFLCMDGSFVDVEVKSIPITYQRKPAVQVIARDISERKRAERELKDAKEQFELFFNTIPDAVVVTRQHDGVIVDINNSFTTISGYTREDVIGKTSNEINIYNNYEDRQKIAAQLLSKGYCNNFETVVQYKGGRLSTVIMSVIFFNLSGITHILNIVRDISDRKQIEEQLRQSEEKYRLLAENSSDVIWMLNIEDMRFTYVSPAIKINTGYTAEEACAMSITESLTKQSSDFVLNDFNSRVEKYNSGDLSETTKFYELQHVCKDGTIIWAESSTTFVTDSDGKIIGILGVTRNIEERKKAEMQIQQKNVELEELNATKDKFFSIIAHDLKTPFSGFLGLTKIMAEKVQDIPKDEMQDFAVNMQKSANNLYQLLENLLEWSRMQRGTKPFNPQYCDLGLILKQNIDLLSDFAKQKSIKIENKLTTNSEAFADIPMLYTVLRNLLSNAIKFTKKEGKVEIGVEDTNDKNIIIWIKDNGIGMNPVMLQKLFRIDQKITRPGTEGESSTGLGLLLSKEFIEKHGGKIWAESEQGIGSTFYFTLPKFENHRKY
jgi:PAS domain S-box-containing protein